MIEARIKRVMGEIFGVPEGAIDEGSSTESVPAWDSLHHMNLLIALEQEFGITFADRDLPELTSFGRIRAALGRAEAA